MSEAITVSHCSIYDVPRAGINIGDGCWGGHLIEGCDVFDTVQETGDHGSFNSWGRDRYWLPNIDAVNERVKKDPELPTLDCRKPIVLRHNRWRCDHGWDIDLDDGSSNYLIEDNLCLHGGIKLREGYGRIVRNNIIVGSSFHPHVWYQKQSATCSESNIVGNLLYRSACRRCGAGRSMTICSPTSRPEVVAGRPETTRIHSPVTPFRRPGDRRLSRQGGFSGT